MSNQTKWIIRGLILAGTLIIIGVLLSGCGENQSGFTSWPAEGQCVFVQKGYQNYIGYCTYAGNHYIETWSYGQLTGITLAGNGASVPSTATIPTGG